MLPLTLIVALALAANGANEPDLQMQTRIRQEGFRNSKVMEIASGLTDTLGARLTGSPGMKRANEWTRDKLTEFGLANARLEPWAFGRGWSSDYASIRLIKPDVAQLYGFPKAWSPGTNGAVRGKVMKVKLETKEDLEKNKGKFAGMIVLTADARELKVQEKAALDRYDEKELSQLADYAIPADRSRMQGEFGRRRQFRRQLAQWAMDERILALVDPGTGDGGSFTVQSSGSHRDGEPDGVTTIALAPEHYNRLVRLVDGKAEVELELDVRAQYLGGDKTQWNTVAEIPGTDKKGEVVMLGAHLDSWHSSTGATDNAAGCAAMMEAVRIIKALGVAPKRTIRIALWSGEEQGLLGSRAYVAEHFASRPEPKDPAQRELPVSMRTEKTPLTVKPEHAKISAYFNIDNGTGKIRGIYLQENAAARPIFTSWLDAVSDLGATTVTMRNTGGTDHGSFDEVGIPGFQFIQDEIEYSTRTHHTNWDSYERLQREDMMQASVVAATFIWEAANRDQMIPRKPMPKE
jgi:hypothetical protein